MRQANNSEHVQIGQTYCAAHTGHNLLVLCRYMVLVLVFVSPLFAVANAYGAGLTDFDMSSIYGTVRPLLLFPLAHCISVWIRLCSAAFSMCMRLNMHPCSATEVAAGCWQRIFHSCTMLRLAVLC